MPLSNDDLVMIAQIAANPKLRSAILSGDFALAKKLNDADFGDEVVLTPEERSKTPLVEVTYVAKNPGDILTKPFADLTFKKQVRHASIGGIF